MEEWIAQSGRRGGFIQTGTNSIVKICQIDFSLVTALKIKH